LREAKVLNGDGLCFYSSEGSSFAGVADNMLSPLGFFSTFWLV